MVIFVLHVKNTNKLLLPTLFKIGYFFQALSTPDIPEAVPHVPGTLRGRKWIPPPKPGKKKLPRFAFLQIVH